MDPPRSLRLLIGSNPNRLITESKFAIPYWDQQELVDNSNLIPTQLQYDLLNSENVTTLLSDYPDIVSLEIAAREISLIQFEQIVHLLFHCGAKIRTLKLYLRFDTKRYLNSSSIMIKLMQSINSMPSLEHLTLEVFAKLNLNSEDKLNLSFITRLKELYLYSENEGATLLVTIKHYLESIETESNLLEKIGLDSADSMEINSILENLCVKSTNRFTRIPDISIRSVIPNELTKFCEKFSCLTSLSIWRCHIALSQLASCLKPLNQIIFLKVCIESLSPADDHIELSSIAQLKSIKVLILWIENSLIKSHNDLHSAHYNLIFPAVQVLEIYHEYFECSICKIDHRRRIEPAARKQCIRLMLQPWKDNRQLEKIYTKFSTKYTEWTVDELEI